MEDAMRYVISGILGLVLALNSWARVHPEPAIQQDNSSRPLHRATPHEGNYARLTKAIGVAVDSTANGIVIAEVFVNMPAYSAGLCKGDKLIAVNNKPVTTLLVARTLTQNIKSPFVMVDVIRRDMRISRHVEVADGVPQTIGAYKDGATLSLAFHALSSSTLEQLEQLAATFPSNTIDTVILNLSSSATGPVEIAQQIAQTLVGSHKDAAATMKIIVLQHDASSIAQSALARIIVQQQGAEVWGATASAPQSMDMSGAQTRSSGAAIHRLNEERSMDAAPMQWNMAAFRERYPVPNERAQQHPMLLAHASVAPLAWGIHGDAYTAIQKVRSAL
ncbi:MAG: PDZ domain-containing protein [Ignavibacteria bacterium]|nr:PDZ domain-containing protein [Ignavibacteria bacterium]